MKIRTSQAMWSSSLFREMTTLWQVFLGLAFALTVFLPMHLQAQAPEPFPSNPHQVYPSDSSMPEGIIGVALNVSAHRIGDPASLYIRAIHPEGPAAKAGLAHGDEILNVDGISLEGKTYQQVVRMIRGDVGQSVKLHVKGAKGSRDVEVSRISETELMNRKKTL